MLLALRSLYESTGAVSTSGFITARGDLHAVGSKVSPRSGNINCTGGFTSQGKRRAASSGTIGGLLVSSVSVKKRSVGGGSLTTSTAFYILYSTNRRVQGFISTKTGLSSATFKRGRVNVVLGASGRVLGVTYKFSTSQGKVSARGRLAASTTTPVVPISKPVIKLSNVMTPKLKVSSPVRLIKINL